MKILLVDDLPANLLALEAILDGLGQTLVKAESGEEALRLVDQEVAVILLDVQMHGLDGFETAKLLRGRPQTRHTPIIFLTAYDENRLSIEEAYSLGAVDYLVKPLIPAILKAKVAGFVELFNKTQEAERQSQKVQELERRQAEQIIADTKAYAENIVESVRDPLVILTADLRVKSANRSFYETFHVAPAETEGRLIFELGNGQWESPDLRKRLEEVLSRNTSFNDHDVEQDFPIIGHRIMRLNARPVHRENSLTGLILLAIEDITERKRIVGELRESEQRFRALFELGPIAVYSCDVSGVIREFNRRAAELWGREPKLGDTDERFCGSFRMVRPDGSVMAHAQCPMAEVLSGTIEGAYDAEVLIERPDGSRITVIVNIRPLKNEREEITGAINCFYDISERKRVEEALRESEQRLASLIDSSNDAIVTKTLDGIIQSWNPAAELLFGYSAEQAVGRHISLLIPPNRIHEEERIIARQRAGERVEHFDTIRLRSDGTPIEVSLTISPIRDSAGRIVGAAKIARDITDQKRLQSELWEADRRKNEFLAMLAHELRNPLAPVSNSLQILRLNLGKEEAVTSVCEMMERQIEQMVRLVDDLLDVSRISRGKIELRKERIELASAVNHAVEAASSLIQCMDQELTVVLPPSPMFLNADPTRLAQVVGNLLNNASKFTDKGGRIWLTVESEGDQAVIRVRDCGIGIAADQLPRIFGVFVQVDTSLERSVSGLGIGLSLVKDLVEMHGGTVEGHSAGIGQGSEFVVKLPVIVGTPQPAHSELPANGPIPTLSRRILVVDDNRDSATSLAMLLKITGNETQSAYDGLMAVDAAAAFKPDLVLMDIGLPKLNGYEACRRIREQPWGENMLLVALTGWGQDEDKQKSKDAGFNAHMIKPVELAALMNLLGGLDAAKV